MAPQQPSADLQKNQIEMDGIPDAHNRVLIEHAICVFAARRQQP
jgi:hypothetical protein